MSCPTLCALHGSNAGRNEDDIIEDVASWVKVISYRGT